MTIFYEVALKLIRTTCEDAIAKSEADDGNWLLVTRNRKVSAAKQGLLRKLLGTLPSLPTPENDLAGLKQLQDLLTDYQERVVAVTTDVKLTEKELAGTTERILEHLSASLHPTLRQFEKLHLLDQVYNIRDALRPFCFLAGMYHAKRKFREKEMPIEQGVFAKYTADVGPFIAAQKRLVSDFFELCSEDTQPWDDHATGPSYRSSKAKEVLVYVYKLQVDHNALIAEQTLFLSQTEAFTFYSRMLNQCLAESINALEALWGINTALQSKVRRREDDTESLSSEAPLDFAFDPTQGAQRLAALPHHVAEDFRRTAILQAERRSTARPTPTSPDVELTEEGSDNGASMLGRTQIAGDHTATSLVEGAPPPTDEEVAPDLPTPPKAGDAQDRPATLLVTAAPQTLDELEQEPLPAALPTDEVAPGLSNAALEPPPPAARDDQPAPLLMAAPTGEDLVQEHQPADSARNTTPTPSAMLAPPEPMQGTLPAENTASGGRDSPSRMRTLLGGTGPIVVDLPVATLGETVPPSPRKLTKAQKRAQREEQERGAAAGTLRNGF